MKSKDFLGRNSINAKGISLEKESPQKEASFVKDDLDSDDTED